MTKGILYLIPNFLGEDSNPSKVFPSYNLEIINSIKHFIVEDERTARRSLKRMGIQKPIPELLFKTLNKHTSSEEYTLFLDPLLKGNHIGLLSDAGCPGVADPGADIVKIAHQKGIKVIPLIGPSSILLALMASGMNGQSFIFHGYLPIEYKDKIRAIKDLEENSKRHKQTQIFIETPYRNNKLIEDLTNTCSSQTQLCIATDLTLPSEIIKTQTIEYWKKHIPNIHKRPAIFLLLA